MKNLIDKIKKLINKIKKSKVVKFYKSYLEIPFAFLISVVTWSVFVLLLLCAAFLIYYYVSIQIYAKKGAGYEPEIALYTIVSGSMEPAINVYDVVMVFDVDTPEELEVGDVITYNSSNFISGETITVTHRIISISQDKDGNYTFYTKGDNNLSQDTYGVSFNQILGSVELKIPQLGRIQYFLATKFGWLVVVVIPALFIIIKYIVQLIDLQDKLFSLKKKKGKFFPIFKRKLLLPYKKEDVIVEKYNDTLEEQVKITEVEQKSVDKTPYINKDIVNQTKKEEDEMLKNINQTINLDDVFDSFKDLTK